MRRFPEHEYRLLVVLTLDAGRPFEELVKTTGLDQSLVAAAAKELSEQGLVKVEEQTREEFILTDAGVTTSRSGFPERVALKRIVERPGPVAFQELPKVLGKDEVRSEVKWLTRKDWCRREGGLLVVTAAGRAAIDRPGPDELFVNRLAELGAGTAEDFGPGVDVAAALELLKGRGELLKRKQRVSRTARLTESGVQVRAAGIELAEAVTQLTPELLVSGKWREVVFKQYDVRLRAGELHPGKPHPLQRAVQETRRAFLEMGFEEAESAVIETAFWNFDALFQPQDHPAREMQDTFYLARPETGRLPDMSLVERVKQAHESGGETGSTGWRYKWDQSKAMRLVLRTHTTATTIQAVAVNPKPPRKVFSVGKVFRRESVDQTHLPEFMQIDGIIIDEDASLATLFGTLREFYLRMGAKEVRFRPGYFPYTEPSAEVSAYVERVGWVEMCGSGVFRPEVTKPLGCEVPVIAWGGGLERVAMLRFGIDDIRKLYWADINWLREAKLCR